MMQQDCFPAVKQDFPPERIWRGEKGGENKCHKNILCVKKDSLLPFKGVYYKKRVYSISIQEDGALLVLQF